MFLDLLNEKEQKNFIELANIALSVDGKIEDSELDVMNVYRREMQMQDYKIKNISEKELITAFQASTKKVKRAVLLELAGVLDADEVIDESEMTWIEKLGEQLGFRKSEISRIIRWTEEFNDLLTEGYEIIMR